MTNFVGMELSLAESYLNEHKICYSIVKITAPKPPEKTDSVRVIRQRYQGDRLELTVSDFKTKV